MSDLDLENNNDELAYLKERAKKLNISFSNNISVEKLREKIDEVLKVEEKPLSLVEERNKLRSDMIKEQTKLIRVRITNMDPKKKDLPGEIFTVGNNFIGTIRKFIPYGEVTDDGYHLPYILYKELDSRKFNSIRTTKDRRTGAVAIKQEWAKEFSLEVLPQLNQEELRNLANAQAAAGSVE